VHTFATGTVPTRSATPFVRIDVGSSADAQDVVGIAGHFAREHGATDGRGELALEAAGLWANAMAGTGGGQLCIRVLAGARPTLETTAVATLPIRFPCPGGFADTLVDQWSGPQGAAAHASPAADGPAVRYGVAQHTFRGGYFCGDSWAVSAHNDAVSAIIVDGLGHGASACLAAARGVAAFCQQPLQDPVGLASSVHEAMQGTVGGVGALSLWSRAAGVLHYCGLGDTTGRLIGEQKSALASNPGIFGVRTPRLRAFAHQVRHGLLVLHTDGLRARWQLDDYPGLSSCHPALIAAVLHRDFARATDDGTVLVVALEQSTASDSMASGHP